MEPNQTKAPTQTNLPENFEPKVDFGSTSLNFSAPEPVSATIPVEQISTPPAKLPELSQPPISPTATPVQPPVEVEPLSQRDQMLQSYLDVNSQDNASEKQQLREDANLQAKGDFARNLYNEILQKEQDFKAKRNELERNKDGKFLSGMNEAINDLSVEHSRQRANDLIAYNIAQGDFQSAETAVNNRIADMDADIERRSNMFKTAYEFLGDDLTESEKVEIEQAFERERAEWEYEKEKEMIEYEEALFRGRQTTETTSPTTIKEINGQSYEWDAALGQWVPFQSSVTDPIELERTIETIALTRDSANRILGGVATSPETGEDVSYDPLYQASEANRIAEFFRRNVGSSVTDKTRLNAYARNLSTNMLQLAGDPGIRDFYGPQMSEADVRDMKASASNLSVGELTGEELRDEVIRADNFLGKYQSAVKAKQQQPTNQSIVYAPDGTPIIFSD